MKHLALAALALLALAALAGTALRPEGAVAAEPSDRDRTITVIGSGSVKDVPDQAQFSFGVETRGRSASAALAANEVEMRRLLDALRASGATDVQTTGVYVSPRYLDEGRIDGFVASNTVTTVTDVGRAGATIDAAVDAGANQVNGPSLTSSDASDLYERALKAAVADARMHAETLAAAAGGRLGEVMAINEGSGGPPILAEKAMAADSGTPIVPGEQETTATVSVTFDLAP